jgi:branched-chain amino acid transport system substrate-binding protein
MRHPGPRLRPCPVRGARTQFLTAFSYKRHIDYGYTQAHLLIQVLKQCGDDLTRENVMRQAQSLHDVRLPLLVPGITINTSPTDYRPIEAMQFQRFDGHQWILFGELMTEK